MEVEFAAFMVCGGKLADFKQGYQWEVKTLYEDIRFLSQFQTCPKCGEIPEDGWIAHAIQMHSEGFVTEGSQLPLYVRIKENKCYICNLELHNESERQRHILLHFQVHSDAHLSFSDQQLTPNVLQASIGFNAEQRTVLFKTCLHFRKKKNPLRLWLFVPPWLPGTSLKQKLASVDKPTYFPVAIGRFKHETMVQVFPKGKYYHVYQIILHDIIADDEFDGFNRLQQVIFLEKIRLLAMLRQRPANATNYHFILANKNIKKNHLKDFFAYLQPDQIKNTIKDVLVNHRTVVCFQDLFNEKGCGDLTCQSYVHFNVNVNQVHEAEELLRFRFVANRHLHRRYKLGKFEIEYNPESSKWEDFAQEVLEIRDFYLKRPNAHFNYIVLAIAPEKIGDAMPTIASCDQFLGEQGSYNVYTGSSEYQGVGDHHFLNDPFELEELGEVEDLELFGTALAKKWQQGDVQLFLLRNSCEYNTTLSRAIEAAYQIYSCIAQIEGFSGRIKVINERLENLAFSALNYHQVLKIMQLAEDKIPLFYDNREDYEAFLTEREITIPDWGLFKGPIFLSNAEKMPL